MSGVGGGRLVFAVVLLAGATAASAAGRALGAQVSVTVSPFTPLGIGGVGIERITGPRRSTVTDLVGSAWRSVGDTPLQFALLTREWRRHRRAPGDGPYLAFDAGIHAFRVRKWDHGGTDRYQEGAGIHAGVSAGVQRRIGPRWVLDAYVGGGTMQSLYKGYEASTGVRYDGARHWNVSGELVPYRTGIMLTYRRR